MTDQIPCKAPGFTLPSTGGDPVSLDDYQGQKVVLFFYPRDNTPGCTTENLDFSALYGDFHAAGCAVFGISKDSLASHEKFVSKKSLTVPLLSDEAGQTCEDYGVWVEKKMYGKVFMGIERATFLIDEAGDIVKAWRKVKVKGHAQSVLEAVTGSA